MRTVALLLALLLSGCSAPPSTTGGRTPVRLLLNAVEGGKNSHDVAWLKEMEKVVEQKHPSIDLVIQTDGGSDESYKAKLVLDLYGGTGADIVDFDAFWTAGMASAGLLQPLDEYLQGWPEWAHVLEATRQMGAYDGKTYVLPMTSDVRGIYYRKDLFAKAGLPVPWQPRTWEDILAAGEALKKVGVPVPIQWNAGSSFGEATTMQGFYLVLLSAGGELYQDGRWVVAGEPLLRTLQFYRDLYVERGLGDVPLQLDPKGRERSFELFRDGQVGLYPEGSYMWMKVLRPGESWGIDNRDEVVGWAPMPTDPGSNVVSMSGGAGYIINKNSTCKPQAWTVLSELASRQGLELRLKLNPVMVPRRDLLEAPLFAQDQVLRQQMEEALPVTRFRPGLPIYPRVSELAQQMVERVIQGVPCQEALQEYERSVIRLVGEKQVSR